MCQKRLLDDCLACDVSPCPYREVFQSTDQKGRGVPRPFVIELPFDQRSEIPAGGSFEFALVLFGRSLSFLPLFIMVFDEIGKSGFGIGKSGYFSIQSVTTPENATVYTPGGGFGAAPSRCVAEVQGGYIGGKGMLLDFITPVQIRRQGQVEIPTFVDIVSALMRRLKLLYRFHSDERIDQKIVELALDEARRAVNEQSLTFPTALSRFSSRQKQRIGYPGHVGKISVEGEFSSLYPWLAVGEYVHVGKGCTFGLGQYKLTILKS